jgi:hypothetical protein
MTIQLMEHRCDYSKTGVHRAVEVLPHNIEYDHECPICGEPLAPVREVLAYIYDELTRGSE